jgi:hypothetical protein
MSYHRETHNVTISGGTGSFTSTHPLRGLLWQVQVEPASSTTTWTLVINDADGNERAGWDDMVGDMNTAFGVEVPVQRDVLTFNFTSDADELFVTRFTVRELPYG